MKNQNKRSTQERINAGLKTVSLAIKALEALHHLIAAIS
jgi:hypothetical protein